MNSGQIRDGYSGDVPLSGDDLKFFYDAITQSQTTTSSSTTSVNLNNVTDTLGSYMLSASNAAANGGAVTINGKVLNWTPQKGTAAVQSDPVSSTSGNTTYLTTTTTNYAVLTYRVTVDTAKSGFEYGHYYDANESAILTYRVGTGTSQTAAFPIPKVAVLESGSDPVPTTYTLSYDANGGENPPRSHSQTNTEGSAHFTIRAQQPTRDGYVFLGWSEDPTAARADWIPGGNIVITDNTTLYAVWQKANLVVDFSMRCLIAKGVKTYTASTDAGAFELEGGNLYFIPAIAANASGAYDLSAMSAVISVAITTLKDAEKTITVLPANNMYFDDDLQSVETDLTADSTVQGYSGDVVSAASLEKGTQSGPIKILFKGARIDAYCTTESTSGSVSYQVYRGDAVSKDARVLSKTVIVSNRSAETRYNIPTVSVDVQAEDGAKFSTSQTYLLVISTTDSSNYRLDAVRVYLPLAGNETAESVYQKTGEQNAHFLELRDQLLNKDGDFSLTSLEAGEEQTGALYIEDAKNKVVSETSDFSVYQNGGAKNEIYLTPGSTITFQIQNLPSDGAVMIGLSEPENRGGGKVSANGKPIDVSTVVDQYYAFDASSGKVILTNTGTAMISVTNLKITGTWPTEKAVDENGVTIERSLAPKLLFSRALLTAVDEMNQTSEAVEPTPTADPEPSPSTEPTDEPTPSLSDFIYRLLSDFVRSLFGSISRLFGN